MSYNHSYQQVPPAYTESTSISIAAPADPNDVFKLDNYVSQSNLTIRLAFVRKVYSILTIQLLVTTFTAFIIRTNPSVQLWIFENPWFVITSFITAIVSLIILMFKAKSYPVNMALLSIFTLSEANTLGIIVCQYSTQTVLQALLLTVGIFIGLTIFTIQSKYDFSDLGPMLMLGLWGLILVGFIQIFFPFGSMMKFAICIIGVLVFCGYIIYDTYMIMNRLTPDDYILASVSLYLDIINLFLYILQLLGNNDN